MKNILFQLYFGQNWLTHAAVARSLRQLGFLFFVAACICVIIINVKINVALNENASRTWYTIKIKLKLKKEFLKRKVFSCLLKDWSELAEVTTGGRLFHTREAATPNARSPMVRRLVCGTMSLWRAPDRSRWSASDSSVQCKLLARYSPVNVLNTRNMSYVPLLKAPSSLVFELLLTLPVCSLSGTHMLPVFAPSYSRPFLMG